jgi:alginate O-acetyltransferase complex protein AlgI
MLPEAADLAFRAANLRSILFTEFAATGLALALALGAAGRWLSSEARERLVVAASFAVVVWFAGPVVTLVLVAWALAFATAVELGVTMPAARAGAAALLVALVVGPVRAIGALGNGPPHGREFVAFGTNMMLLRGIWWARARWRGEVERTPIGRVCLAFFFFPTFVNGPIEAPRALVAPLASVTTDDLGAGLARIGLGAVKIVAAALLFPIDGAAGLGRGPEAPAAVLWGWAVLLYVWFFLSFSAWTDVAIGLGRLCGRRVCENFDRPWRATDPADFWRRWHVSFGTWLREVVYIPLGGNRRHRTVNVLAVFAVSAAWHVWGTLKLLGFGYYPPHAWIGFAVWGCLHAVAVSLVGRRAPRPARSGVALAAARLATFLFAALAWVPFFTPAGVSWRGMARMLARMVLPIVP